MNKIKEYEMSSFEAIKHIDEYGNEYFEARELQVILEYSKWENFQKIIDKAIIALIADGSKKDDWLLEVRKPIKTGKGRDEHVKDYKLSRHACYLIVQNGDPRKKVIAFGQKYFAVQTRKQELSEQDYSELSESEKRFYKNPLFVRVGFYLFIFFDSLKSRNSVLILIMALIPMIP